jgi:hypothetical protein
LIKVFNSLRSRGQSTRDHERSMMNTTKKKTERVLTNWDCQTSPIKATGEGGNAPRVLSARTKFPNTSASDLQPEVMHVVKFTNGEVIELMARDPTDAIAKAERKQ